MDSPPPKTSAEFDSAYRQPITFWGDTRIPKEIKTLIAEYSPHRALELGCGLGRFSRYVAQQGVDVIGVDHSPVAVSKAQTMAANDASKPRFIVGDVTRLDNLAGKFDVAFDVGCFHCLNTDEQRQYASVLARLLAPGGVLLIWAMNDAPSGLKLSPAAIENAFTGRLQVFDAQRSRRRMAASHWYWLKSR